MKKLISILLALLLILFSFAGCGTAPIKGNTLRFTNSVKSMQKLDGQEITITGYMSAYETDKNYYFYLVSSPCNTNPFAADHSKKMADTVAVYAKAGEKFEYTDGLITVTGTLNFGDFTDSMGYTYSYRIKNASFTPAPSDSLSKNEKKWQSLSDAGIVARTDAMLRYVEFICTWPALTMTSKGNADYLTPELTFYNLDGASALFGYGKQEGYFDKLIEDIKAISDKDYEKLVEIVEAARETSAKALAALEKGEYSIQDEYSGVFGDGRKQYKLNDSDAITAEFNALAEKYAKWLDSWKI